MIGHRPLTRHTLITALAECAETGVRARARRFLSGLSGDELEFIAECVGSCILEESQDMALAAERVERAMGVFSSRHGDREYKLILLREYLRRSRRPIQLN